MTYQILNDMPIALNTYQKSDVRTQFAALCYRIKKKKTEILMITSRGIGRWIIPKGWPADGKTPTEAALTEAWEEAGVRGKVTGACLGLFSYNKDLTRDDNLPCVAMVFPVRVKSLANDFPEVGQRKRKWMRPKKAAAAVAEPELAQILARFDPDRLIG